jgi:phosphatidylglycerophosphatase A
VVIAALVAGSSQTAALIAVTALLVAASVACVALGSYAEHRFGRKDAPEVVADETAGVCLPALVAIGSTGAGFEQGAALALAFILFRVFDIAKPWPVARLESLPSGWGVLLDDLMAGLYAAALLLIGLLVWSG